MRQTYPVSDLLRKLEIGGVDLVTRDFGQKAYPFLEEVMRQLPTGFYLVFDFNGVRTVDTAFARESFGQLLTNTLGGHFGGARFILANLSVNAWDTFETLMKRRGNGTFFLALQPVGLQVVGHMEPNLEEVFELLKEHKELSARDLADQLNLEINTASTRLKKLHDLGATMRREEVIDRGRQHIYRLLGV
jgi:STAS-like domain of unknown function (DUF4325)/Winged helix-turn-helix DNA-binding